MTLPAGSRLGPYEIIAPLGAGGMGEVYRARDTRLGRDVAIKVLPDAFAHDPERVARFEREAKLLASLNHSNVGVLYGVEREGDRLCLALELIEGESLADRLRRGAIPLEDAFEIASQVASALVAAHDAGVVHRDLKPGNVMLRADGVAKVLDFGLARGPAGNVASPELSHSPTLTSPTVPGVILGTAGYMSPEQVKGRVVDRRADVWAWGCLLYEMLGGRRAFPGDDASETLAGILKSEPDWSALPSGTPRRVRELLARCLRKDARERWRDLGDARLELLEAGREQGAPSVPAVSGRRGVALPVWAMSALAVALVGAGGLAGARLLDRPSPEKPSLLLGLPLEAGLRMVELSPDGTHLACVRTSEGRSSLTVLDLRDGGRRDFPGVIVIGGMFWSPDGREVAVFHRGDVDGVDLNTGVVRRICSLQSTVRNNGTWSASAGILLASNGRLFRVPSSGGTPEPVAGPDSTSDTTGVRAPYFLPDGKTFLIARTWGRDGGAGVMGIELRTTDGRRRTRISGTEDINSFAYDQGHLIYINDGALLAQRLDLKEGRLAANSDRLVVEDVRDFSVARDGVLYYERREDSPLGRITWLDRNGRPLAQIGEARSIQQIELGPDGNQALVSGSKDGLLFLDLERGVTTKFDVGGDGFGGYALWSRDGRFVYYSRGSSGALDIWRTQLDGAHPPEMVIGLGKILFPGDLAPGESILAAYTTEGEIYLVHLEAPPRAEIYARVHDFVGRPRVSPDGRWLLYASRETGEFEVYLNSWPSPGTPFRISPDGGRQPHWREDGREIVYVDPDSTMKAVECVLGSTPRLGNVRPLFRVPFNPMTLRFDMTPDAQRFLVSVPESTAVAVPEVKVLVNWPARLAKG